MNLIRTSFYTSISTAVTFVSGFIVTKVVAVKIGPSGMAFVGQFQNTIAIFAMLSTLAIVSGVIKYLAQYKDEPEKQQRVITTALTIVLLSSLAITAFVLPASGMLSELAFHTKDYWMVYFLYGFFITIIALNAFIAGVLNGLKQIRNLTIVNIVSSLSSIAFTILFAYTLGVKGVLIASNFVALVVFCINIYFLRKIKGFSWKPQFGKWDTKVTRMLFAFTLMGIVTGFATPATQLIIRDRILSNFSENEAGCWQAITRISDYYLGFVTTVLAVYYLPRLSEIVTKAELRKEIIKGYKIILPTVGLLAFIIWLCKVWVVHILFTKDFLPMLPLFKYQLLGDFMKIGSWLLGYITVAKGLTKIYVSTEILFNISLVLLTFFFMDRYGLIGTTYAFAVNYACYWLLMYFLMRKYISTK